MRKFLGFIAGSALAFFALAKFFIEAGVMPRGPLWGGLCIVAGLIGARLASRPKEHLTEAMRVLQPVTRPWWRLDKRFRLVIVASIVWIVGAYLIQDRYDEDMGVVFIPAFAALALNFLVRETVDRTEPQFEIGSRNPGPSQLNADDIYNTIAEEFESGILDKGLWTRLFAESDGNEAKTKVRYIRERMSKLSVGQKRYANQNMPFSGVNTKPIETETYVSTIELSPRERDIAMEELIKRMK